VIVLFPGFEKKLALRWIASHVKIRCVWIVRRSNASTSWSRNRAKRQRKALPCHGRDGRLNIQRTPTGRIIVPSFAGTARRLSRRLHCFAREET